MTPHREQWPKISWHRGGREVEPHATRSAFLHALRSGAEVLEIDVRSMGDGTLVCVHDAALPGIGTLCQQSYGDLNEQLRAEIYTLEEFVDDLEREDPRRATTVHFDLKERGFELQAVDALLAKSRPLFVTTLERSSVTLLRQFRPETTTLLTLGSISSSSRVRRTLHRLRELFPFIDLLRTGASGIAIHVQLAKPWILWWCKRRNLMVAVWTIDGTVNLERWLASAVDVVTTNCPLKAIAIRERLSAP